MKKFKEEKGITLVALIITIVVLLILAMVAIGAVQDSNIIGYAQNAAGSFNQAKSNEIEAINGYEELIEENTVSKVKTKECYLGIIKDMDTATVVDYENKVIKIYIKNSDGSFNYATSTNITNVLETSTPLFIKLDGQDKDIGTGGIKLELEEESLIYYIKDNFLFREVREDSAFSTDSLLKLEQNFDFNKLVE